MRNIFLFLCLCLSTYPKIYGQYTLRIEVKVSGDIQNDSIFIAGSFNNWDSHNVEYSLRKIAGKYIFEKQDIPKGIYEYKFTRGSWKTVEAGNSGSDIQNGVLKLTSDTTIQHTIADWKDHFTPIPKPHTASNNVHLMDSAFHMSKLNRDRKIWIYLPPGYHSGSKKYPVFYMHDGQNLFDAALSGYGEWGIDEILDSLACLKVPQSIVIGIENGTRRMNEYNPYFFEKSGAGEGDEYIDFIVNELKPYVDKHYQTLPSKENTIIAGSSLGGLISYFAALKYPSVFGRAGIFSPAFWIAPQILSLTDSLAPQAKGMFFFYIGKLEGVNMMIDMNAVISKLGRSSNAFLYTITDPTGIHNEDAWRKWFPEFYLWATSNGHNHIIRQ